MDNVEKVDVQDALYFFKQHCDNIYSRVVPVLKVKSFEEPQVTKGDVTLTPESTEDNIYTYKVPEFGAWTVTNTKMTKTVNISEIKIYNVDARAFRFGFKIDKNESDPYESVSYMYDAEGMTPAKMNFETGLFEYGDWKDVWFVKDNRPCMLKFSGEVDYYLNPDNYAEKENGAASDYANSSYLGNAMAQFPLCWVYRYEDDDYYYQIVSNVQWDENYKAYAHTDKDGNIKPYFYNSLFVTKNVSSKMRSIANVSSLNALLYPQGITCAEDNGEGWSIGTWSQRTLIVTLLTLISKSLDSQSVFGNGNVGCYSSGTNDANFRHTGSLYDKGQFYGYNSVTQQVKVFHVEDFWGNVTVQILGLVAVDYKVYAKMTPPYSLVDFSDYTYIYDSAGLGNHFATSAVCSEFGLIPIADSNGTSSTFFCDGVYVETYNADVSSNVRFASVGADATFPSAYCGAYVYNLSVPPEGIHTGGVTCQINFQLSYV